MEEYRIIADFPKYEISNMGNVRNAKTGRVLKSYCNKGYLKLSLQNNDKSRATCYFHILVANTFIANPENKPQVDHINNNKADNRVENLRFATVSENSQNRGLNSLNTSGVKGCFFSTRHQKWRAQISIDGINVYIGSYDTLEEAKNVRIQRANQAFGAFVNACEKI